MIAIGSEVELAELASNRRHVVRLVNPGVHRPARGEVSVFSALGRALTDAAARRATSIEVPCWPKQAWRIAAVRRLAPPAGTGPG